MLLPITRGENLCSSRKVTNKSENIFAYATGSAWTLMSVELYTTVLVAFHPGFSSKFHNYTQWLTTYWCQLKQLNSMEILIYFIFYTIGWVWSTWQARRKVDRSTPAAVRTLSVNHLLFYLLSKLFLKIYNELFSKLRMFWWKRCKSNGNSAWNTAFPVFTLTYCME